MKTIKYNHNTFLKNISKILVAASIALLSYPCIIFGYEPENPKLKKMTSEE